MTGSMTREAAAGADAAAAVADGFGECGSADGAAAAASSGYGCFSPRISFSTDFAQLDKVSSPNRRTSAAEYSAEFEFCLTAEESLLLSSSAPADEIFFNGKLLPLHLVPSSCIKELLLLEEGSNEASAGQSCESSACPSPFRLSSLPCSQQNDYVSSPPRPTPTCTGSWKELLGLGRKSRKQHFKLVRLFFRKERSLGDSVKAPASGVDSPADGGLASSKTECQDTFHLSPAENGPRESENSMLDDGGPRKEEDPEATPGEADCSPDGESNLAGNTLATEISSSPATSRKGNSGRIMLKNLERCTRNCTAARSSSFKQPPPPQQQQVHTVVGASGGTDAAATGGVGEKQVSGSFSTRVAPVLNVPMCMDPVKEAKTTMTGLRRLLSGKKPGGSLHRVSWTCPGGAL